ncbi:hypothetical protein ACFE04_011136 [Oxalis oulophora]
MKQKAMSIVHPTTVFRNRIKILAKHCVENLRNFFFQPSKFADLQSVNHDPSKFADLQSVNCEPRCNLEKETSEKSSAQNDVHRQAGDSSRFFSPWVGNVILKNCAEHDS